MLHTLHCDVEVEYDARYKSLVLRIYLPSISYSASDALYEDHGIKYREYRALFYEGH